ncbi:MULTISPECIES: N-acetylmuramidase family protein [Brucella]|uniref:N-acetylmuramidase family protein n=1 Tax=Brucella lupini TaxID=255457 RepID=A0A256GA03_9HYPH|nr:MULTISPECIES: N-acetylmuramidase family protein [Brucella]RNL42817.1 N-acetylmuramidase family protein [Ochrobactrum sp. MH181795]KAB2701875.1 N-acetylmuramidase family protein [Brucella lupini]KAB2724199.1 N-acetylmuramidase family protein [Brucella anthropi]KAB2739732.1 N-acetylmuramidase family protein [Brucella anthropi]KAB2795339.1 N-acetylmuramidase family protein [Brucella anthropi]
MFDSQTIAALTTMADETEINPAALLAIAEVESGGKALFDISGGKEPAIRFEGHYFDRRLSGRLRDYARTNGLSAPVAGQIRNPKSQAARWLLLERAMGLSKKAALESTSWGLGQVMGAHWEWLGYATVDELVAEARGSIAGQARLMLRFIEKAELLDVLKARNWREFARRYNGPAFARNEYDKRMAEAYQRWQKRLENFKRAA